MGKLGLLIEKVHIKLMSKKSYIEYLRNRGVRIGDNCIIEKSAYFGSEPWLISIGNNVRITQDVKFITHDGGLWTLRKLGKIDANEVKYGKIVIGDNCNISWNTIIMPDVVIGNNCVIAAGAVVTKNIPDGEVWGGVPARFIETIDEYYMKIKDKTVPTYNMSEELKREYLRENKPDMFI